MYKKNKIIITIVIIFLVSLIVAGVVLFTTTDLFKSNKTLFWKNIGIVNIEKDEFNMLQLEEIEKQTKNKMYTIKGKLKLNAEIEEEKINFAEIDVKGEFDTRQKYAHANVDYKMNDVSIISGDYVNNEDTYAIKSDDIVIAYVGIKNENLDVLARKIRN